MNVTEQEFARFKEQILKDGPRMGLNDTFRFECHSRVACFNHCCHDVNIFLTPYDIIRMKNRLGITSGDFLDRYCVVPFNKEMRYPLVALRMKDDGELSCPFLKAPGGCSVYEDRPWSCRMYPIGRAAPSKELSDAQPFYFLIQEDFCKGHESAREWTVAQWMDAQRVPEFDRMGEFFQGIVQHRKFQEGKELSPEQMDMLFMVFYDVDRFRRFVFGTKFLKMFDLPAETVDSIRIDDVALMKFGFDWLRFALWREPSMRIREDVVRARKANTGVS
jgi:hypothetical protein